MEEEKELSVPNFPSYQSVVQIPMERGRVVPNDLALEQVVLGGMLIDEKGVEDVIDFLKIEMFYNKRNQLVFKAIYELFSQTHPVDILSVIDKLRSNGDLKAVGGEAYVIELTQKTTSAANIKYHGGLLLQYYIRRELIRISNEINEDSYDETKTVLSLLDESESKLYEITNGRFNKSAKSAKELIAEALDELNKLSEKKEDITGVSSGFRDVDIVTAGWQPTDLIIIAARPAMGKTAFTLTMARNIAVKNKQGVAFFSLEMGAVQLIKRLISSETGIEADSLRRANKLTKEDWDKLDKNLIELSEAPLYIDDTQDLSLFDLKAKARRLVEKDKVKIIMIDYLQLMTVGGVKNIGNREQEISAISRGLKSLAKELNVPVIALSQLSRGTESRQTKRPQLSDLRESGAIEQDADIVTFLYRPEYYGLDTWDDEEGAPTKNQSEFMIAKHRNGETKNIRMRFYKGVFSDLNSSSEMLSSSYFLKENNGGVIASKINSQAFNAGDNKPYFADEDANISEDNNSEVPF